MGPPLDGGGDSSGEYVVGMEITELQWGRRSMAAET